MLRLFFLFLGFIVSGGQFCLFASVTNFEFVEEPNSGEHEIRDAAGNYGPIALGSFKITLTETPADFVLMDQYSPVSRLSAIIEAHDPDAGVEIGSINLYEGLTYLYLFGRNPQGQAPWVVGPRTFEDGRQLYFIVDQGPPRAPEVGNFYVGGNRNRTADTSSLSVCKTDFATVHAFYMNCNPTNSHVLAEIVFNSFDNRFTTSLGVSFVGTVTNNTSVFDTNPDEEPNPDPVPGAVDRKESNAIISAQMDRILGGLPTDGPPLTVQYVSDVMGRTGPFALDMTKINLNTDDPQPNTDQARSGEPGEFSRIGFDEIKNLADGNYEIIVGARDAAGNFSPGGFVAFGNENSPVDGVATRIIIIKDTISPQKVSLYKPESVFIFGNTPPSVDPPYEDAYWTISGNVYDERNEMVRVHVFSQDSPDQGATLHEVEQGLMTNPATGNFQALIDASGWAPVYPTQEQIAYRWVLVPEDLHGNVSVNQLTELFMIKDTVLPPTPYFTDLYNGYAILNPMETIRGRAENDVGSAKAEHGTVEFVLEIFHETSLGSVGIATYNLPGASDSATVTDSLLDDSFVTTTAYIPIIDPMGVATNQIETVNLPDRTEIFNNKVYPDFAFNQTINFKAIPDGMLRFELCLIDQVGNKSDPCTSVTVFKDLTGPVINFDLQNSGPDDNYDPKFFATLPNFYGADDHEFRVSLKSPELTPDPHSSSPTSPIQSDPHHLLPGIPEPDNIALLLRAFSSDSFSSTTKIEVWGSRIQRFELLADNVSPTVDVEYSYNGVPFTVSQTCFDSSTNVSFGVKLPLFDLFDGVNEVVNLRALDSLGNWGPTTQISIIRDVTPPAPPIIMVPPKLQGFSLPVHYTNTDTMTIHGRTESGARIVVFLPPEGSEAGFPMPPESRIKRTSSQAIPILSSDYNSITTACAQLKCLFPEVREDGSFYITGMDISTIAQSLETATTIYIQAIDSFDNTDPQSSVAAIEIHKNQLNVPVEHVFILNYPEPGAENVVQIYPDSLGESPALSVFSSFGVMDFRIKTKFPMLEAPDLKIRQHGYMYKDTGKKSSTFPSQLGTFVFEYTYEIQSQVMEYDGIADFSVSGGKDMFGNQSTNIADINAFIVDTVAPNRYTSPSIILSPVDSTLLTTFVSARIDFTDFFKNTTQTEPASGVETDEVRIRLYGPLHESPDSVHEINLTTFVPVEADFDLAASLAQPLSTDGVYRLEFIGVDKVGNRSRFDRTFVLDREAIVEPLLLTLPQHGSAVNTMPFDLQTAQFFNRMTILDIEADFNKSGFEVFGPGGLFLETIKEARPEESSIYGMFTESSLPHTDGSSDGFYEIHMSVSDKTGNQTTKVHRYLLDTQPMQITTFYPTEGQCVSRLELAQFALVEDYSFSAAVSGLDRKKSRVGLFLEEPYAITNPSAVGRQIQTTIAYLSDDGADIVMSRVIESGNGLPTGGEFDGIYRIEGDFSDLASNSAAVLSTFIFDSIRPTINLSGFGDGDYVTRQNFRFEGTVADRGFCGLPGQPTSSQPFVPSSTQPLFYSTESLSLRAYKWNLDTQQKEDLLLGPVYPDYIVQTEPYDYPAESTQAHFVITGMISGGSQEEIAVVAFEWTLKDRAGNEETLRRIVNVSNRQPPYPRRKEPLQEIDFRGQKLSYYTSNPVQLLRWEAVDSARYYDLHLKREALGTVGPTTTIRLPVNVTSLSVDFALVNTGISVPLSLYETLSWRVDTIDAIGQSSNYFGEADIEDPPEIIMFDRQALTVGPEQVFVLKDGVEYNLSSYSTFATAPDFTLRFRPPEPLRVHNTSESAWIEFYRHTACPPDFSAVEYDYKLSYNSVSTLPVESDIFDFNFMMPEEDVNGCGVFHIAGFRDRAGNRINDFSSLVKVDRGPKFEVKLFQNPVDPLSFTFIFKGIDYDGRNDLLLYDPDSDPQTPRAYFQQAGFGEAVPVELIPVQLTPVQDKQYAGAYTGSFNIDIGLLGNVALKLQGIDLHGHEAKEDVYLQVDTNRRLQRSESRLSVGKADETFTGAYLYGYRRNVDSATLLSPQKEREFLNLPDFPWLYYPKNLSLSVQGDLAVTGNCEQLVFVSLSADGELTYPNQQKSCHAGSLLTYTVESAQLNSVYLVRDAQAPQLEFPAANTDFNGGWNVLEVHSQDLETGVSAVVMQLDQKEYIMESREAGVFTRRLALEPGRRDLQLEAIDWAGNRSVLQSSLQVLKPFGIERCAVYPNPVRRDAFMECVFTRAPENCRFRLFDAAGRSISIPQPSCGANIKERVYMEDSRGRQLANGVYFLRIQADYQGTKVENTIKFAILR